MKTNLRRVVLLITLAVSLPNFLLAQSFLKEKFGFKVGLNHSNMNFQRGYLPAGHIAPESLPSAGLNIGVFLKLPLTAKISVQPEYFYASRRSQLPESNSTLNLQYLSMPVLLHYELNNRVSLHAGPQVDLLIHATKKNDKETSNITHDTEERNLGMAGGIRYDVVKVVFIECRYIHGINNVGIGQRSDVSEFKYGIFEISAGIRF